MITLFTSTKPFLGAAAISQRNTIACWRRLDPSCEVLLIGEEVGSAEVAREFGARLIPDVERNEFGTPLLRSIFSVAEAHASFPLILYANADILFTNRLIRAAAVLGRWRKPFLLFGRRWDFDLQEPFGFRSSDWEERLESFAKSHGKPGIKSALDYFLFSKGAWGGASGLAEFPPIVIGRPAWDNWIVFWALARRWMQSTVRILYLHSIRITITVFIRKGKRASWMEWKVGGTSPWSAMSAIYTGPSMPRIGFGRMGGSSRRSPPTSFGAAYRRSLIYCASGSWEQKTGNLRRGMINGSRFLGKGGVES